MAKKEDISESFRAAGPYMGLGVQLAATIVGMVLLGNWIDKENGTTYWLWIFAIVGGGGGMYNFIKTVLDLEKKNKIKHDGR
jgi:F0F1-type ATP synthase assembly protein I